MTKEKIEVNEEIAQDDSKKSDIIPYIGIFIQTLIFLMFYLFLAALLIGFPLYLIFGLNWVLRYMIFVGLISGFPFLIFALWLWIRFVKKKKIKEIKPIWQLFLEFFLLMGVVIAINVSLGLFLGSLYFYIFFYPLVLVAVILWIIKIKKRALRDFILLKPKFPVEGNPKFYYFFMFGWIMFTIIFVLIIGSFLYLILYINNFFILIVGLFLFYLLAVGSGIIVWIKLTNRRFSKNWFDLMLIFGWIGITIVFVLIVIFTNSINFAPPKLTPTLIAALLFSTIGAPIVEEIIFRGYFYKRAEEIYGDNKYQFKISREKTDFEGNVIKKPIFTIEILYIAIITSIFFGIWHTDLFNSIRTFFAGLIYCKLRKDSESIVPCMIWHSIWNTTVILSLLFSFG